MSAKYQTLLVAVGLAAATFAVFSGVMHNEFVRYDDQQYVTENTHIQILSLLQTVKWAFTSGYAANWHPLTWLSHTLDYKLFGLNPSGHHLVNLIFHIANVLLLFAVLNMMTRALWRSAFVAALFALHPLHVESIAWVAERKDVLSTFFWFLTMAAYLRYVRKPNTRSYLLTLLLFALGLMSKPMLVTLPLILLLLDYWPLKQLELNNIKRIYSLVLEKMPFFILSVISSIITCVVQQHAMTDVEAFPLRWRIANAIVSYVTYIEKMFVPRKLAVLYPLAGNLPTPFTIAAAAVALLVITILVIKWSSKRRYLLFGWLWFIGTLVPVIGLVQVGMQEMADRYTYVPLIGLFIIVTWGIADVLSSWRYRKIFLVAASTVVLVILSICTIQQLRYWRDSESLFKRAVAVTQGNYICYNNLGDVLVNASRGEEAIAYYKQAIEIKPDYADAYNNLGSDYDKLRRYTDAIEVLNHAIELKPDYAKAYYNLGVVNISLNRFSQAAGYLEKAVKFEPDYAEAYHNLGSAYNSLGRYTEAIDVYKRAIEINPNVPDSYNGLGNVYFALKNYQQAIEAFIQATKIKPDYREVQFNLGVAYAIIGQNAQAMKQYEILKSIEPKLADKLIGFINKQ